jgi:hypothetical protein
MEYVPTQIISRIEWCRLQQKLASVTRQERAGGWAEEAGLVDALLGRDRTDFMREHYPAQFECYQRGLEDGRTIMRLASRQRPAA